MNIIDTCNPAIKGFPYPKQTYKVFVRCITYNQSDYILDTLNGFVSQITEFPYLCFIIDDASTDGEQHSLLSYVNKECDSNSLEYYDDELSYSIVARHKTNKNCTFVFYLLKQNMYHRQDEKEKLYVEWRDHSVYEAICEGDDYWNDNFKLQQQVDFLDKHPDYGMCYTQCNYFYQNEGYMESKPWGGAYEKFEQFMKGNTVPTMTILLRSEIEKRYQNEIKPYTHGWMMGDYPRWIWYSHESKVKFLPICTGVYRVLAASASHSSDINKQIKFSESSIEIRLFFERYFNIVPNTYVDTNALKKRKLYLYSINHHFCDFLIILLRNPSLLFNMKSIGYFRHFLKVRKSSEHI